MKDGGGKWVVDTYNALSPFASSRAYVNFIDADLVNWESAYYGENYSKLRAIKSKVGQIIVFNFLNLSVPKMLL